MLATIWLAGFSCTPQPEQPLKIFIAGSLAVPFAELEQAYEDLFPVVDVQVEAHGSIQVIRYVTEIQDEIHGEIDRLSPTEILHHLISRE